MFLFIFCHFIFSKKKIKFKSNFKYYQDYYSSKKQVYYIVINTFILKRCMKQYFLFNILHLTKQLLHSIAILSVCKNMNIA